MNINEVLRDILRQTSTETGDRFFASMAVRIAKTLGADVVLIGELATDGSVVRSLGFSKDGIAAESITFNPAGTPFENIMKEKAFSSRTGAAGLFPEDSVPRELCTEAFVGVPLFDSKGRPRGILVVFYRKPVEDPGFAGTVLEVLAYRISAEIERRNWEAELRIRHRALESSLNAIAITDTEGKLTYVNPALLWLWGYREKGDVLGRRAVEFWKDRRAAVRIVRALEHRGGWSGVLKAIRRDGSEFDAEVTASMIRDSDGMPLGMIAAAADITDRKKAHEMIRESEARFRHLAETIREVFWIGAPDWNRIYYISPAYELVWGRRPDELYKDARIWLESVVEEDREALISAIPGAGHLWSGEVRFPDYRIRTPDGTIRWISARAYPVLNNRGIVEKVAGIAEDITERKETEQMLRANEERIRFLMDSTAEAIYGVDTEGICIFCNASCVQMLGYSRPADLLGNNMHRLVHHSCRDGTPMPQEDCRICRAFHTGEYIHDDNEELWRADATSFPVEYWSYPQRRDGKVVGAVVTFIDLSDRKSAEDELKAITSRLGDRVKELECLYGISRLLEQTDRSLPGLLSELVKLIPSGWQYPEAACARIRHEGMVFQTANFTETVWKMDAAVYVAGTEAGSVEVFYLEEKPGEHEGPFLLEEKRLIGEIAIRLGNVIERKRIESSLQESEEIFRLFMEYSPIYVFFKDDRTRSLRLSRNFEKMLGRPVDALLGKTMDELFPSELARNMIEDDLKILREGKPLEVEEELHGRIYSTIKFPVIREGKSRLLAGFTVDITDRKRAEEELKLDEDRLETLLQLTQMSVESEEQLVAFALEEGVRLTRSKGGYLHFFNEDEQTIRLHSWSRNVLKSCSASKEEHYPLSSAGIWADSVRFRRPVIHNDYQSLSDKKGYPEGHFHLVRHLGVPIFGGDRIVGVAGVGNKEEPYDESDVRQMTLFMNSLWAILQHKRAEQEREEIIRELQDALAEIKTLSGLLPICASCKKIRDDKGYWTQIESYISAHSEARFSHGLCPSCAKNLYPDYYKKPD